MSDDTAPMVTPRRVKKSVKVTEHNKIAHSWDTIAEYESDNMPQWFQPLQPVIEDDTFTSMIIVLGNGDVHYLITATEL